MSAFGKDEASNESGANFVKENGLFGDQLVLLQPRPFQRVSLAWQRVNLRYALD